MAEWRTVKQNPRYEVSDSGQVRSLQGRYGPRREPKVLALRLDSDGYVCASLATGGKPTYAKVHHLVLEAFVGERPIGHEAGHRDGVRNNNGVYNLKWCTHAENLADIAMHGTMATGERLPQSKLTEIDVIAIRETYKFRTPGRDTMALAARYGVSHSQISLVVLRKSWRHVA